MANEQRFPLNWSDVKAWADRNHRTKPDPRRGGYYTECPVRTHRLKNQLISVWDAGDGYTHLRCWGRCKPQDIYEAIAKKIKPRTAPDTEDTEPPSVTKPRIEVLEREWNSPEAQLDLDQLIDEQFADEQTAEYWESQATEAKAELEWEREARLAAEKTVEKVQDKLDKSRRDYKSVNAKLSRRDEKIQGLEAEMFRLENDRDQASNNAKDVAAAQAKHAQERDARIAAETERDQDRRTYDDLLDAAEQERIAAQALVDEMSAEIARVKERETLKAVLLGRGLLLTEEMVKEVGALQEELPVSKSEVIKDAWELLDQNPSAALPKAWTVLEQELKRFLKIIGLNIQPKASSFLILRNAYVKGCINSEQYVHLLDSLLSTRNRIIHPDDYATETLQLTKPQARAALAYLEQVIDQLRPAKAGSQDLQRLKAHYSR